MEMMAEEGVPMEDQKFSQPLQVRRRTASQGGARGHRRQAAGGGKPEEMVYWTQAGAEKSDEVSVAELCSLIEDGTVPVAGSLLWREGMARWAPVLECVDGIDGLGVAVAAWEAKESDELDGLGAGRSDLLQPDERSPTSTGRAPEPEPELELEPEPEPEQVEQPSQHIGLDVPEAEAAAIMLQSHTRGYQARRTTATQRLIMHVATLVGGDETARDSSLARLEMDASEWLTAHGAGDIKDIAAELEAGTLYDLMAIIQAPLDWTVFFDDDKTRRDALWQALQQEKAAVMAVGKPTVRELEPEPMLMLTSPTNKRGKAEALSDYMQQVQAKRQAQDESRHMQAPPEVAAVQTIQANWGYSNVEKERFNAAARIQANWRGKQARLAQDALEEDMLAALLAEEDARVYDEQAEGEDVAHVTVICPAGADSGDLVTLALDGGDEVEVVIPEGIYPGMSFTAGVSDEWHHAHGTTDALEEDMLAAPLAEKDDACQYGNHEDVAHVTVVCPAGADSGDVVTLALDDRDEVEVVIPEGISPGLSFTVGISGGGSTSPVEYEHTVPPFDVGSALLHAGEFQSAGKWNDAHEVYTKILENSSHLLAPGDLAELYNRRGLCCEKVGDAEQALGNFSEGIQLGSTRHSLLFHRGRLLAQLGRWSEANGDLSSARDLQPSHHATVELLQQAQEQVSEMQLRVKRSTAVLVAEPEPEPGPEPELELEPGPLSEWWDSEEMVYYHTPGIAEPSDEVPLSQLCSLIADGTVPVARSCLWQEGMTGWAPISECVDALAELAAAVAAYSSRERTVFYDDVPGLFSSPDHLDLAQCEGMLNSRLITVPENVTNSSKYWTAIRENRRLAVERLRQGQSPLVKAPRRPRAMSMSEVASTVAELRNHSALVFDCGEDSTTVYRLQYESTSGSVRASIVAECAGVGDLISRHAGSWFLKFAKLTYEEEKAVSVPEVVMVGTAVWYSADSDEAVKKLLYTIWTKFKKDHCDGLDQSELRRALDEMGKVMGDHQFTQMWLEIDKDDSGHVSFDEFEAWYRHHHDAHHAAAGAAHADRAHDLVSSLTQSGMLCKRVGGSEQALFESLAVCEVACRHRMSPRPQYFIGTGASWIHCVALNASESPIILRNDDVFGWSEGVRRLNSSLDPLAELDAWLQDTVVSELDAMESHCKDPIPVLNGSIVLSGAAFEAAEVAEIHSEADQLRPICAKDAIDKMAAELTDLRKVMSDNLISYKTTPSLSPEYIEGQQVARQLCNLTLHIELLKRRVREDTTLFFKAKWKIINRASASFTTPKTPPTLAGGRSSVVRKMEGADDSNDSSDASRPTWVIGWYMHLLSSQFGVQFRGIDRLIDHLNGLYSNAISLANLYDEQHASSIISATQDERVALTLVSMRDVVEALRKKAQAKDLIATKALQTLSKEAGGTMEGLEFRFKSEESLFRKLTQRLDRQLMANEHIPHCKYAIRTFPELAI
eukprot:COSAG02_NODE_1404_length_12808_cov_64.813282_4_plen_1467_part_00